MNTQFAETAKTEDRFQVETYAKLGISVERGNGAWIWTSEGERYLDLYGGHAVCATGHSHPLVVKAICDQAEKMIFYSNMVYSGVRGEAAAKLVRISPSSVSKVFFCNSGTEANENAMRMARLATGREKILSFEGGFHGRTADSISSTFLGNYRELGRPNVPGHVSARFGDIDSVREAADGETAAIILEPIQSMAGIVEADPEFFVSLRELCNELGIVLIFDEVQTGMGRTGRWFFSGSDLAGGIEADIVTLAKSLGSGIPVGACLVNEAVAAPIGNGDLGTTFGGGMIAMAAVSATIDAIESGGMLENAGVIEKRISEELSDRAGIQKIRGKGCLIGIEFDSRCKEIHKRLLDKKIITGTSSDPAVLRLLMPMCVTGEELELLFDALLEI